MPLTEQGVVDAMEIWLKRNGFVEVRAIPAGARGFDITAVCAETNHRWIIEAKGGAHSGADPSNTACARVGAAFMTAVSWRFKEGIPGERFAIAVPKSHWFDTHLKRIERALALLGISVFQVSDDGRVSNTNNAPS